MLKQNCNFNNYGYINRDRISLQCSELCAWLDVVISLTLAPPPKRIIKIPYNIAVIIC